MGVFCNTRIPLFCLLKWRSCIYEVSKSGLTYPPFFEIKLFKCPARNAKALNIIENTRHRSVKTPVR